MTDVWEISKFVEAHPENYDQRWRLAKKLYMTWEYRLALEHLQVLQNEWEPKENVLRYLGATLYRLNRFEEAVVELKGAIELFPEAQKFREQLAQTFIAMGDKRAAADVWEDVADIDPEHRFAKKAVKKLRGTAKKEHKKDVKEGKFGTLELPCPMCGAENSPDLRQCWQCNGPLPTITSEYAPPVAREAEETNPFLLWGKIGCLVMGALTVFLIITFFVGRSGENITNTPTLTLHEYFIADMIWTRILLGIGLLVAWPIFLRLSLYLVAVERMEYDWLTINGVFLALLTFVLTWVPSSLLWSVIFVPALVSGLLLGFTHNLDWKKATGAWCSQAVLCLCIVLIVFGARHGIGFLGDMPYLFGYAQGESSRQAVDLEEELTTPTGKELRWTSTGSEWVDSHVNHVVFRFDVPETKGRFLIELRSAEETLEYQEIESGAIQFSKRLTPDKSYWLKVVDEGGSTYKLTTRSALPYDETQTLESVNQASN